MRKAILVLLLLVVVAIPAQAFTPAEQQQHTPRGQINAVAWIVDDELFVAVANDSLSRTTYTIEADSRDYPRYPFIEPRTILVSARSVVVESFRILSDFRWSVAGERLLISERFDRTYIPIQTSGVFSVRNFVMPDTTWIEVEVDLLAITEGNARGQVLIDEEYQVLNSNRRGPISVSSFEGGYSLASSRNVIQYTAPYLTIGMRTPGLHGVNFITYGAAHVTERYAWDERRERIEGPTIMVYGPEMRYIDNTRSGIRTTR